MHQPRHVIGPHEVHIWHALADELPEASWQSMRLLLSREETERLGCLRRPRDRALFLLSRAMMRSVLASYLACACHEVQFAANDHGKPTLRSHAEPFHFNLTHSRGAVAFAVSHSREVGIDVEERERVVEYLALAERFFAPEEAEHLRRLPDAQRPAAFFAIWTLKEAYVKGIGRGISFPLDAFCFDFDATRLLRFRPLAAFVASDWQFHQFDLGTRHCGALAVQNQTAAELQIQLCDWHQSFAP